jgi:uncharacterized SAM-binding protein YcdF (DUF218 family)
VARDLIRLGAVVGLGAILVAGYATFRIWDQGDLDEARPAGAIVVLGAAQYDGAPSPLFRERLRHATELYREGYAPFFVVTGGKQPGDRTTEAAVARQYALRQGIADDHVLMEDRGRTTLESIRAVAVILRQHGIEDAIFVSDPTHMLRVLRMASDQGITAWGSPTRSSPLDRDPSLRLEATIHELGALGLYFVSGDNPVPEFAPPTPTPSDH